MIDISLNAVRNLATGKHFIFVEEAPRNHIKLINPDGKVLTVPAHLFDTPNLIHVSEFEKCFTPPQLQSAEKEFKGTKRKSTAKGKTTKRKSKKTVSKTGLGASWASSKLTFYKYEIEPLDSKQTFRISLDGEQKFEISKEQFQANFGDVILSHEYSREGSYSYPDIPDKAKKFIS